MSYTEQKKPRTAEATKAFRAQFSTEDEFRAHMAGLRGRQTRLAEVGRILITAYERYLATEKTGAS